MIEGKYAVNRAGYALHSAIHAENPDVIGSCHAHTANGDAWAAMGKPLDYVTQDACMFYGSHTVVRDGAGKVPVANESGNPIARAFNDHKAIIHQNHGLLTASRHSIDDAVGTSSRWITAARCSYSWTRPNLAPYRSTRDLQSTRTSPSAIRSSVGCTSRPCYTRSTRRSPTTSTEPVAIAQDNGGVPRWTECMPLRKR
ncbi:ribulose-5-phosphate 4-epimerase/fuculose-1-phosphate aldolase [Paraburkholderia sp. JPY681]|nr:ribulose-5-phosphate 4-epimerase/fuculose-1-phosphate aldolase [Paraburkholderia atlantica]